MSGFPGFDYMGGVEMRMPRIAIEITPHGMNVTTEPGMYVKTDGIGNQHVEPFYKKPSDRPWMFVEAEKFIERMNRLIGEDNARMDIQHAVNVCGKKKVGKMVKKAKGNKRRKAK